MTTKEQNQAHYQKYRQTYLDKRKRQRQATKDFLQEMKLSLVCELCGENHPACLHYHHREPQKKSFTIANSIGIGYSVERIKAEMAKCQVLCANCHAKLHHRAAQ